MNYAENNTTMRAAQSSLWPELSKQQSKALPYLLERYLLLSNGHDGRTALSWR